MLRGVGTLLYLIEILHQTTTLLRVRPALPGCILSKFYIKPQLYSIAWPATWCCILSKFYIKPQLAASVKTVCVVVSYRNSTSNHNVREVRRLLASLYLIEILHQTTTMFAVILWLFRLYLIEILHQTTTPADAHSLQVWLYLIEILHQTTTPTAPC